MSSTTATSVPSTSTSGSGSANSTPGSSVAAAPSGGCTSSGQPASGTTTLTPTVAGKQRTAVLHVPAGYSPSTPVPLVVNMHGSQSTASQQEGFSGMDATSDADTFLVVYPQGDIPAGAGYEWNVPGQPLFGGAAVPAGSPDDVSFIEKLVSLLEKDYCVDTHRVFATGFSGGARMASQLGCDASAVFAAVAPVSGLRVPSPCPSTRAVPVVAFHGTADPVDPYTGNGQKYWTYSVPVAAGRWAVHNGCTTTASNSVPAPSVALTTYAPCTGGSEVQLYSIVGEGHEWPGGPTLPRSITRVLGPQSSAVSANSLMWSFFLAHPLS
jgi:polyhydroxybutyrate depolymerase